MNMDELNSEGVPKYPKGDARRLFILLAAIAELGRPTIWTIAKRTGLNKGTIDTDVAKLNEQFGVEISKDDAVFTINSWGDLLNETAVKKHLPDPRPSKTKKPKRIKESR